MTNTKLLKEKIEKSGYKIKYIAERLGITRVAMASKINNDSSFKVEEMVKLSQVLNLSDSEREQIFFGEL